MKIQFIEIYQRLCRDSLIHIYVYIALLSTLHYRTQQGTFNIVINREINRIYTSFDMYAYNISQREYDMSL